MATYFRKSDSPKNRSRRRLRNNVAGQHSQIRSDAMRTQLLLEPLEDRRMLAVTSVLDDDAAWTAQGPAPILNDGSGEGIPAERPVSGAIQAVATHPSNAGIIWLSLIHI